MRQVAIISVVRISTISVVLLAGVVCRERPHATLGFHVHEARPPGLEGRGESLSCDYDQLFVMRVYGTHRVQLNDGKAGTIGEVLPLLKEALMGIPEALVMVRAEPNVSYADVIEVIDAVYHETDYVSLMTPKIQALKEEGGCPLPLRPRARGCVAGHRKTIRGHEDIGSSFPDCGASRRFPIGSPRHLIA